MKGITNIFIILFLVVVCGVPIAQDNAIPQEDIQPQASEQTLVQDNDVQDSVTSKLVSLVESDTALYEMGMQYTYKEGGIVGLKGAVNIEIDSDNILYVAGHINNAISILQYDTIQDTLVELNTIVLDTLPGVNILGVWDIAVSKDKQFAYVSGNKSDSLVVFKIIQEYQFEYVASYEDVIGGVSGMQGIREVILTPDEAQVIVVSEEANSLVVFQRNMDNGTLQYLAQYKDGIGGVEGLGGARGVAINKSGTKVYAVGYRDSTLVEFDRDSTTGALTMVSHLKNGAGSVINLHGASTVAVSNDGARVFVVSFFDNAIVVFSYDEEGNLVYEQSLQQGKEQASGLKNAYKVIVAPNDKIYVSGYADNALSEYEYKESKLLQTAVFTHGTGGIQGMQGAWGVQADTEGRVFITGYKDYAISWFDINTETSLLDYKDTLYFDTHKIVGLQGAWGVEVSPDNRFVYTYSVSHNKISIFRKSDTDNSLQYIRYLDLQADITEHSSHSNIEPALQGIWNMEISEDGKSAYCTNYGHDALIVLSRTPENGNLSFVSMYQNGIDTITGLQGAHGIVISKNQRKVYVTGYLSDSLVVFDRSIDGTLTLQNVFINGVNDIIGLNGAYAIAESSDETSIYVTSRIDNALVWFQNTANTLSYKKAYSNGVDGILGLGHTADIAVHPNNSMLYVTGEQNGALVIFERNQDGSLAYITSILETSDNRTLQNITQLHINVEGDTLITRVGKDMVFFSLGDDALPYKFSYMQGDSPYAWNFDINGAGTSVYAGGYAPDTLSVILKSQ